MIGAEAEALPYLCSHMGAVDVLVEDVLHLPLLEFLQHGAYRTSVPLEMLLESNGNQAHGLAYRYFIIASTTATARYVFWKFEMPSSRERLKPPFGF